MSIIFIIFVIQFEMILEKQVELLLLARILDATEEMDFFEVNDKIYSYRKPSRQTFGRVFRTVCN